MLAGIWLVVGGENSAHNILVEFQTKGEVDLLSNAGAAVSRVAPFHLDNGINDFFGRTCWAWFASTACGIQLSVLPFLHGSVKPEQGRRLDNNG